MLSQASAVFPLFSAYCSDFAENLKYKMSSRADSPDSLQNESDEREEDGEDSSDEGKRTPQLLTHLFDTHIVYGLNFVLFFRYRRSQ